MPGSLTRPQSNDRRQHPRRERVLPVNLVGEDGRPIRCASVDVSVGGMKVVGRERMPVGPADVVIDDLLALHGEVVEEIVDLRTGSVTARIRFLPGPAAATAELVALADLPVTAEAARRIGRARNVLVAAGLVGVVLGGGFALRQATSSSSTAPKVLAAAYVTPTTAPQAVTPTTVPAPTTTVVLAPDPSPTPTTVAPAPAAPAPAPAQAAAPATTTETADNMLFVTIADDPSQSSGTSTVGPSSGVDDVKVQLDFTPDATDAGYPVAVSIENRRDDTLTFGAGGASAVIRATDEDTGAVHEVTVQRVDVTELAPGATLRLEGAIQLAPGHYELTTATDVTRPASS